MTVQAPGRLEPTRDPLSGPLRDAPSTAMSPSGAVGIALAVVAVATLTAIWPVLTLLAMGVVLMIVLALRAPPFALVGAILFYGLEGAIKVGLARELPAIGVTPAEFGAAVIDFVFLVALLGVVRQDRGRSLLGIWRRAGRWIRIAVALLGVWIAVSLVQLAVAGDLDTALAGFRLTQAYVLAVLAGAMLLPRCRHEHAVAALVAVLLVIAAYAAFRAVAGPSASEQAAAFARSTTPLVPSEDGVIFRNIGSFSSAIGLASFLVPAGVFLFAVGLFFVRLRAVAWIGFALVLVALVGSHVRTSLLAVAGGICLAAALLTFVRRLPTRRKIVLGMAGIPLLVVFVAAGAVILTAASGGSEAVGERSSGLLRPLSDASLTTRLERWERSLDVAQANPLGTGIGTVGSATIDQQGTVQSFADNSYLKVLEEQGLLGAIPFILGICIALVAAATRLARSEMPLRGIGAAAVAGSASFFLLAWTSEAIEQPGKVLSWLLLGIALWAASMAPQPTPGPRSQRGDRAG